MKESFTRIGAVFMRYLHLHKRSLPRTLEIIFWPVMELLVWGFVSMYIRSLSQDVLARTIVFLINAMIFWDLLYRSQQGVSISIVEDVWTQNIINVLVSPLRIREWVAATFLYGMLKTFVITVILSLIAFGLYRFNLIAELGFYFIPLAVNLLIFGWALGIFASSLVIRWGHAAEALIWGIPFLIQPFSAIYYPLDTLPGWLQVFSRVLPSTYVFEGMREIIRTGGMPYNYFFLSLGLNLVYFVLAGFFFNWMYKKARVSGHLSRLGVY